VEADEGLADFDAGADLEQAQPDRVVELQARQTAMETYRKLPLNTCAAPDIGGIRAIRVIRGCGSSLL
jgi:hypothetical protein